MLCVSLVAVSIFQQANTSIAERIVASARRQAREAAVYDARYVKLDFPGGDVARDRGCCADVVIRALRSVGKDLQALIYKDAGQDIRAYPAIRKRDWNIDHRRVRNIVVFFTRYGTKLPYKVASDFRPGDFVVWKLDNGRDHIGIVTDKSRVVHNLSVCREEDCLTSYKIVGRFRYPKP